MKAFWWFEENAVAGMARPGFNLVRWYDLPFDEAAMLGWVGKLSSGVADLNSFKLHLKDYLPRVYPFYKLDEASGKEASLIFETPEGVAEVLNRLARRTRLFERASLSGDVVEVTFCRERLKQETEFLRSQGIKRIVSLTESQHEKEFLAEHFTLHHLGIQDLYPPTLEQAQMLAEIFTDAKASGEPVAIHCLAGIGRTSTMILAAHILMGHDLKNLETNVAKKNPSYALTGSQGQFVRWVSSLPRSEGKSQTR